jgi:hypothetical protein
VWDRHLRYSLPGSVPWPRLRTRPLIALSKAGKDVRVGVYVNVQDDCTSGPLPTIRLSTPAAHGRVTVKKAKVPHNHFPNASRFSRFHLTSLVYGSRQSPAETFWRRPPVVPYGQRKGLNEIGVTKPFAL